MLSPNRIKIKQMDEEDRIPALHLLMNSFFRDEPLAKCLELDEPVDFAQNLIEKCLNIQCSFVAYDVQTNKLIGICLNEIIYKHITYIINEANDKIKFILQLLNFMHRNINLFDHFQADSLFHIFIINVDRNYRGYGISSDLISSSIECAKILSIKGIYAEATSIYSFNSFQRQGFQSYGQLNYVQYDESRLKNLNNENCDRCQLVARKC